MSQVFFAPLRDNPSPAEQVEALEKLLARTRAAEIVAPEDFVAIKLHVGEGRNNTHVRPELIKAMVGAARDRGGQVFLTETSTLYKGDRSNAVKHLLHAQAQGFGIEAVGAPFIMADGLTGGSEVEVAIGGELERSVKIAREIAFADVIIAFSHPTGHLMTGLGACLKNLGMGLASRAGKLRQHSSIAPAVKSSSCRYCRKCLSWCPAAAIAERGGKAYIDPETCTGCGECLTVCRYDAVRYNWGVGSETLQKRMVEYALGAIKGKKAFHFNVLVGMTANCDCMGGRQKKILPDQGILASADPVAIDRATLDLTAQAKGKSLAALAYGELDPLVQLRHGEKLGLGSMQYDLMEV